MTMNTFSGGEGGWASVMFVLGGWLADSGRRWPSGRNWWSKDCKLPLLAFGPQLAVNSHWCRLPLLALGPQRAAAPHTVVR